MRPRGRIPRHSCLPAGLGGLGFSRIDGDLLAVLVLELEPHHPADQREQGIVAGPSHVLAGMKPGAALRDENAAGRHRFAPVALHAEVLGIAVASVPAGTDALLVCHGYLTRASDRSPEPR